MPNFKPKTTKKIKMNKKYDFIVSVSHEKEFAIATVIAFQK